MTGVRPLPDDGDAEVRDTPVAVAESPVVPPNAAEEPLLNAKVELMVADPLHWHPATPQGKHESVGGDSRHMKSGMYSTEVQQNRIAGGTSGFPFVANLLFLCFSVFISAVQFCFDKFLFFFAFEVHVDCFLWENEFGSRGFPSEETGVLDA